MKKTYPTFVYGQWVENCTIAEINEFKNTFYNRALESKLNADHIIYAYYDYDLNDNRVYHFDILPKTEKEFDNISKLSNYFIYAIHRR